MRASYAIAILVLVAGASAELSAQLRLRAHASGFNLPIAAVQDPADRNVQFVVQQDGHIRAVRGGELNDALFRAGLVDELHLTVCPKIFGGRGAPYHFGSRVLPRFDRDERVFTQLHTTLQALFPALGTAAITHRWGGAVAVPRDWYPSVGFDRVTGVAWAGGYVGDGVSTTNLAGRTIADLVLGHDSDLVRLPWVGHVSPRWEPEPLRWLGVNLGRRLVESVDHAEAAGREPRLRRRAAARLLG
jgi:glycine/D-amino acid oxidase-like deaminating enzyme